LAVSSDRELDLAGVAPERAPQERDVVVIVFREQHTDWQAGAR
jgi:hypothetical protein